jgi:predicted metalloendopeptidase
MTPECVLTASTIISSMDFAVDPCTDFFQFSCGSWIRNNPIPEYKSRYGSFDQLSERNKKVLRDILEGPYEQTPSVPDKGGEKRDDRENFERLKSIYDSCRNETNINGLGIRPVRDLVTRVRSGFPLAPTNSTAFATTILDLHSLDVNALFAFYVDADQKEPDVNTMYLDQRGLGLPSREYYKDEKVVAVYKVG